jgi:uncharacterized membrane protein HdeD (DUF308 family)
MTSQASYPETAPASLTRAVGQNWWLFLLRGIAAIVFGVLAFILPGITLVTLVLLYGAFALVDGVFALVSAILGKVAVAPRWWLVIVGLAGIGAGIVTFLWPGITALVLLFFIAGWAIANGIFQIIGAIQLRKEIDNEWWLILNGALSVLFGIALFVLPGAGALALIWLIGLYAIVYGILLIGFAFKVRKLGTQAA